jgi:hypothetical protein
MLVPIWDTLEHRGILWNTRDLFHRGVPPRLWNKRGSLSSLVLKVLTFLVALRVSSLSFLITPAVPVLKVRNSSYSIA